MGTVEAKVVTSMALQVARGVEAMLGDEEGEAEQMVAVLDARQATTLQVTRKVNLIKKLALDLNQVSLERCAFLMSSNLYIDLCKELALDLNQVSPEC